jgi:phage tail-like protein
MRSRYLQYLPGMYQEDEFLDHFLMIFEDTLSPVEQVLRYIHLCFDPTMAPEEFLPWLAAWVDLVLDENWPIEKRRRLIRSGVELYRWRGTRRGLAEYLKIYTDVEPEIVEHFDQEDGGPHHFTVTMRVSDPDAINERLVRQLINGEKPAHTTYELRIEGEN